MKKTELRATEFRQDGITPRHYEVVHSKADYPPAIGWDDAPVVPDRAAKAQAIITGTYEDRARGFAIATWQISVVTGAGLVVAAIVLGDSLSFVALSGWFFAGFVSVWFLSFMMHTFVSAEGSQFIEVLLLWTYVRREQTERHKRMRSE